MCYLGHALASFFSSNTSSDVTVWQFRVICLCGSKLGDKHYYYYSFYQEPDFMSSPSSRQQMMLSEESTLLLSDLMKQQLIPSESPAWKTPEQQEIISCAAPISWDHDSRYNSVSVRVQIVDRWALREIICLQRLESMLSRRRTVFYRLCSVDMKSIKLQDIFSEMDDSSKIILDFNTKGIRIFPANTRGQWVVQGAWERGAFRVMVKPSSGVFF